MTRKRVRKARVALRVRWSRPAERDLKEIIQYIKKDSSLAARDVFMRIRKHVTNLALNPLQERVVPELQHVGIEDWRELTVKPYRIVYRVDPVEVEIDLVADARRDMEALLMQRLFEPPMGSRSRSSMSE